MILSAEDIHRSVTDRHGLARANGPESTILAVPRGSHTSCTQLNDGAADPTRDDERAQTRTAAALL